MKSIVRTHYKYVGGIHLKKQWIGLGFVAMMLFSFVTPAVALASPIVEVTSEPFELTILHLNDHHSHLESQTYDA